MRVFCWRPGKWANSDDMFKYVTVARVGPRTESGLSFKEVFYADGDKKERKKFNGVVNKM